MFLTQEAPKCAVNIDIMDKKDELLVDHAHLKTHIVD